MALIENSYSCLGSSRPITRISNGLHSSLTRRHRRALNNLSPRSYRKVPSASWYDGSIVLEEERGLPRDRHTERYETMRCTRVLSRCSPNHFSGIQLQFSSYRIFHIEYSFHHTTSYIIIKHHNLIIIIHYKLLLN